MGVVVRSCVCGEVCVWGEVCEVNVGRWVWAVGVGMWVWVW